MELTDTHLHILRHSLGLNSKGYGYPYRNIFCAGPGHRDYPTLKDLVQSGHMVLGSTQSNAFSSGSEFYHVTEKGLTVAQVQEPPLPRSKRRWRRFSAIKEVLPGLTFKEFLTLPKFAEYRC